MLEPPPAAVAFPPPAVEAGALPAFPNGPVSIPLGSPSEAPVTQPTLARAHSRLAIASLCRTVESSFLVIRGCSGRSRQRRLRADAPYWACRCTGDKGAARREKRSNLLAGSDFCGQIEPRTKVPPNDECASVGSPAGDAHGIGNRVPLITSTRIVCMRLHRARAGCLSLSCSSSASVWAAVLAEKT